jgi:hypothetical protein
VFTVLDDVGRIAWRLFSRLIAAGEGEPEVERPRPPAPVAVKPRPVPAE